MHITIRPLVAADVSDCIAINRSLPAWFGLEEGLNEAEGYLRYHAGLVAEADGTIVGYLTHTLLFEESAEISWMAVAASSHRQGAGKALIDQLERDLRHLGVRLLSVKTLAATHPSAEYALTRGFYTALSFHDQMVFPELWGPSNPCLLMVKTL